MTGLYEELKERWEFIPKWQKWFGFVILLFIVYFFIYIQKIKPKEQKLSLLKHQFSELSLRVNRLKTVKKRGKLIKKEIKELNSKIEMLESKLPTGKEEVSKIIKSITGSDSGVRIDYIERKPPIERKYYVEIPYLVKLSFRYPDFISWCEKLSTTDRIINFSDMTLVSYKEKGEMYTVKAELTIKAYNLKR